MSVAAVVGEGRLANKFLDDGSELLVIAVKAGDRCRQHFLGIKLVEIEWVPGIVGQ